MSKSISQFIRFALVGALNTAIDFGVFNLLIFMFGLAWSILAYPLFKSISFIVAVTNSYFWNRLWVFKSGRGDRGKEFLSFMVVSLIGLAINVGLASYVFLKIPPLFGLSQVLWANAGVLAALIASLIWNFFGYKLFVFHK